MTRGLRVDAAAVAGAVLLAMGLALSAPYFPERFSDVRAFYCAGTAQLARADPYRAHPLTECQRSVAAPGLSTLRGGVALPAPFPGCVLALFALLALLPFGWALALWVATACGAVAWSIALLGRITATPLAVRAVALGFPALTVALPLGQLTPFILLALVAAANRLTAGRPRWAALAALGAMLDPHVGAAVVAGLAVGVPRTRATLAAGLAAFAAVGIAVGGFAQEWEYVSAVIPAHALANLTDSAQFSATNFAYVAGMPAAGALAFGTLWYLAALVIGSFVALKLRARLGVAAIVLIPPAFAVFGGTHTHLAQLALALPAFLLAGSAVLDKQRPVFASAIVAAAIPWLLVAPFPALFPAAALMAIVCARSLGAERWALALAGGSFVVLTAIFSAIVRAHVDRPIHLAQLAGNPLAEAAWQISVRAHNTPPESWYLFAKAPTVIAFLALFAWLIRLALHARAPQVKIAAAARPC